MAPGPRRSTAELVVLAFTFTLCLVLLTTGGAVLVVELVNPDADTTAIVDAMKNVLQVVLGAVVGYLVRGSRDADPYHRADTGGDEQRRPREDPAMSTSTPEPAPQPTDPAQPEPQPQDPPTPSPAPDEDPDGYREGDQPRRV